ncbi:MAG: DUF4405 domain-containing protein [Desulfobacteraceae bacterium]|nr:DUF4405 domain-containing protein [Desulfobacteraceae bacterium]
MKIRKITSLTALVSFLLLITTSFILYVVPAGRVAYWANWKLLALTKEHWTDVHINLGFLFLISIGLHIYYNWKPIVSYLKNKTRQVKVFTPDFNAAVIISIAVVIGTLVGVPPFSTVIGIGASIKQTAADKYGEPPYGHAEMSNLKSFATRMGMDLGESMNKLKAGGIKFDNDMQTLSQIAEQNDISPQQVYLVMAPSEEAATVSNGLPAEPKAGLGNRLLSDICEEYALDVTLVVSTLEKNNIKASSDMTMKTIAADNGMSPHDVYDAIKVAMR